MAQGQRRNSPTRQPSAQERTAHAAEAETTHEVEREHQTPAAAGAEASTVEHGDGDIDWVRPSSLDAPPPRPGMVQRWKRHELGGAPDTRNWQRALREGWRPRAADTVDEAFSSMKTTVEGKGVISAEGLILCEMPAKAAGKRTEHYRSQTARQMQGVEADLHRTQSPGGPRISKDHRSRTDQGRLPNVAGD
ncbi:hypothetical protein [Salinisphaera hydrothermalis]|uniref:Uncharacterized protein n=1 Tax=Salinisphaera hydrothermalis (strain C41B8) TaxID=1304275 RepID=A0A084INN1_SALHC|nr:hypothetical protein [Salinisphaera hydrothermalis]KEZ78315.1 hypothetical protein C41B8_05418 [Salinisphaera hydrothermalis C41B8]